MFVFEQTRVIFNYRVLVETTGAQLAFFQFERPGSGIWKIIPETLDGKCLFYPCKSGIYGDGTRGYRGGGLCSVL